MNWSCLLNCLYHWLSNHHVGLLNTSWLPGNLCHAYSTFLHSDRLLLCHFEWLVKCNASGSRTAFETGDIWTQTWKQRTQVDRPRYEKLFVAMGCIWLLHRIHAVYFDLSELVPFQFTSPKRPLLSLLADLHFAAWKIFVYVNGFKINEFAHL